MVQTSPHAHSLPSAGAPFYRQRWFVPLVLLVLGFTMRMIYGWDLPRNFDERGHLEFARTISLEPDNLHLPLGSGKTNHPVLVVYVIALADWLGGGSTYFIRTVFILLSLVGLAGLFLLTRELFGWRAGCLALALGALDHHLIQTAATFLEPVYLWLVPWLLLAFYRAAVQQRPRWWLLVGLLFGIGYQFSEVMLLLVPGLTLFVLLSRRLVRILKTPYLYAGVGVFLVFFIPHLAWNMAHGSANLTRHGDRISQLGLSPRVLLLYVGDLLIMLKSSTWILLHQSNKLYLPINIPVHWFTGLIYLVCTLVSLRFIRDCRHGLLLAVILGVALPVTVMNAGEPWNEFGWASITVLPVIALSGFMLDRLFDKRSGRTLTGGLFVVMAAFTLVFLSGLKYGYASPHWEKAFLGEVLHYYYAGTKCLDAAHLLAMEALEEHPDSIVANYLAATTLQETTHQNPELVRRCFQKILRQDPDNPLVHKTKALWAKQEKQWDKVIAELKPVLDKGRGNAVMHHYIAEAFYHLGRLPEARHHIAIARRMKPDEPQFQLLASYIYADCHNMEKAIEAIDQLAQSKADPAPVYLLMGRYLAARQKLEASFELYRRARRWDGDLPRRPPWIEGDQGTGTIDRTD